MRNYNTCLADEFSVCANRFSILWWAVGPDLSWPTPIYRLVLVNDSKGCRALVKTYEAGFEKRWPFESLPDDYVQKMMQGIVGFEIPITRLEGKFKLNQNRPVSDQLRVATALNEHPDDLSTGVAALMKSSK